MRAVFRLAMLGMVLSLAACGLAPQIVKDPGPGQSIAIHSLNVAVLITPSQGRFPTT